MHFKGLDLNLLVVLDALLEEESVSKAALRLHVSQPAVSAALAKLRWHTGDELLHKIGRTTRLTPRALAMMKPLKEILIQIEATVRGHSEIDLLSLDRTFSISMTSLSAQVLLPGLVDKLVSTAPLVRCSVEDIAFDTVTRIKTGELDFCVTFLQTKLLNPKETLDELNHASIFNDRWVAVVGNENRRLAGTLDFETLCSMPYVETRPGGIPSMVERVLDQLHRRPRPMISVQTFELAISAVIDSDCVAIVPSLMIGKQARPFVRQFEPPFAIPEINEYLVWHSRNADDPGHGWFRNLLLESSLHLREAEEG